MINHIVLFRFKPGATEKEIKLVFTSIQELASKFSGVQNFSWGTNTNNEGFTSGYNHALFLQFDSEETRTAYQQHPYNHKISKEIVIPALCNKKDPAIVFDYTV